MKTKKAAEKMLWIVATMAFVLFFFLLYSNAWATLFGKGTSSLKEQLSAANDADLDRVINIADKCPCPPKGEGVPENYGCPAGYKIKDTGKDEEDRSCLTKKT